MAGGDLECLWRVEARSEVGMTEGIDWIARVRGARAKGKRPDYFMTIRRSTGCCR